MKLAITALCLALCAALPAADSARPSSQAGGAEARIVVKVFGKVAKAGAFELPHGSTLLDALAVAGGWTPTADLSKVAVLRGPADEIPKIQLHDVRAILKAKASNPKIEDGDAIHIEERIL